MQNDQWKQNNAEKIQIKQNANVRKILARHCNIF